MTAENSRVIATKSFSRPSVTSTIATDRRPSNEAANDALQQRNELPADALRGVHDLGVIERLRQHAGRHVRDARDAEHLEAHMSRNDGFRYRRHAHGVRAD